ncbi:MAG: hypothetical protein F6K42_13160, partial [Leptolyngbya sp. SIO1D8]|nr:hypothetical protein [Leptolyngbya sp. SIO1D8]
NPTSQPKAETILQSNLLHIATQLQIDERSLSQQLLAAVETVTHSGHTLTSELSQILPSNSLTNQASKTPDTIATTPSETQVIERLTQLLTTVKHFKTETPIAATLHSKIDALLYQLSTSSPDYSDLEALVTDLAQQEGTSTWHEIISDLKAITDKMLGKYLFGEVSKAPNRQTLKADTQQSLNTNSVNAKNINHIRVENRNFSLGEHPGIECDQDIYIQNAGLVLLWPFLSRFFETLELVQDNQFRTLQATHQAVLFLQYLTEAAVEPLEHALPLNKLLCGVDLADPVPSILDLSEIAQHECIALLTAVIQNWSVLKTTSVDGFRRAFLQRAGILRSHHGNWLLQVERQTYDVLIDQLPWSIRVVKLPWMEQVLYTEW